MCHCKYQSQFTSKLLSRIFLGAQYHIQHYLGIAVCLTGLAALVYADLSVKGSSGQDSFIGDVLCLFGSMLYAVSNVGQEYILRHSSRKV